MSNTTPIRFVRPRQKHREPGKNWIQLAAALLGGILIFVIMAFFVSITYRLLFTGRIFPGISIAGVDVSGLNRAESAQRIQQALTFPGNGRIVLKAASGLWIETPANLGMTLDSNASTQVAYDLGRNGGLFQTINDQLNAAQISVVTPPVIVFDQRVAYNYLQTLAQSLDKPVVEASLTINGLEVNAVPGQLGQKLDIESTLVYLRAQMQTFRDGTIPLVLIELQPQVLDASAQAEAARRLLSAPFTISLPSPQKNGDPGPWQIQPVDLAPILRVGRVGSGPGSKYMLQFDSEKLQVLLESIIKQVDRSAADARFVMDEPTSQIKAIQPSIVGLKVDRRGSIDAIQKALVDGQQSAALSVIITQPKVADTATSLQLGITQQISSQTTYFFGSTEARKKNIETAASKFHGLLVAPGEIFSMGQYMGDISLDSGFAEALIIFNGKTIKGVGGGVCQVSTTLFRTVFYAGFPVIERHAHAYRVFYYEQGPGGRSNPLLSGFDATVYFPLVDFKFQNDSPYWLLMETFYDSANYSLTWKFYSTSDGRTVDAVFSGPTNIIPALPPTITFNPDAESGSIKHVDYKAEGADINISRNVLKNGNIFFSDGFVTKYEPWADACEYGPDVKDPEKLLKKRDWCQKP